MDDFLHNLRANNQKAFERSRRNFDGNRFKPNDRQNLKDKYKSAQQKPFGGEQLMALKKAVETLSEAANRQADAQERQAAAEERKATAMEAIAAGLERILGKPESLLVQLESPAASAAALAPEADTDPLSPEEANGLTELDAMDRDALMARITSLREMGASYKKIAEILEEEAVPTLSGRGRWSAQTISRLFKESEETTAAS